MATTNKQEVYTLTEQRFNELSKQDGFELPHTFECIILEHYNRTRQYYKSDEEWYLKERRELSIGVTNFESGWYKQAAKTAEYFSEKYKKECEKLTKENNRLTGELAMKQGELNGSKKSYDELYKKFQNMISEYVKAKSECDTLRDELNSIRA